MNTSIVTSDMLAAGFVCIQKKIFQFIVKTHFQFSFVSVFFPSNTMCHFFANSFYPKVRNPEILLNVEFVVFKTYIQSIEILTQQPSRPFVDQFLSANFNTFRRKIKCEFHNIECVFVFVAV